MITINDNNINRVIEALTEFVVRASKCDAPDREVAVLPEVARILGRYIDEMKHS